MGIFKSTIAKWFKIRSSSTVKTVIKNERSGTQIAIICVYIKERDGIKKKEKIIKIEGWAHRPNNHKIVRQNYDTDICLSIVNNVSMGDCKYNIYII